MDPSRRASALENHKGLSPPEFRSCRAKTVPFGDWSIMKSMS